MDTAPTSPSRTGPHSRPSSRAIDVGLAVVALIIGVVAVSSKIFDSSHAALDVAVDAATGVLFVVAGLTAASRTEQRRVGRLLMIVGAAWFSEDLVTSSNEIIYSVGQITMVASAPLLVHLVLSFPSGRLPDRLSRITTAIAYALAFVAHPLAQAVGGANRIASCPSCPRGALRYIGWDDGDLFRTLDRTYSIVGIVIALWVFAVLAWRFTHASPPSRVAMGPFLIAAITLAAAVAVGSTVRANIDPGVTRSVIYGVARGMDSLATLLIPLSFLAGLVRLRLARAETAQQLVSESTHASPGEVRELAGRLFSDPRLAVLLWRPQSGGWIDESGAVVGLPAPGDRRVVTVVQREGRPLGALVHDVSLRDDPELEHHARVAVEAMDLSTRLQQADAGRATARADERRRLRNELHDGLGPALAGLTLHLDAAQAALASDPERAAALLERIRADAERTIVDLRHAVHGLRPPALDALGFLGAIEDLAAQARPSVAVDLETGELPALTPVVEAAGFRIVQEALTNVLRHSGAQRCSVRVVVDDGALELSVSDDGRGLNPAAPHGVGLGSMRQRAEEAGGTFTVDNPPDGGTIVRAHLPLDVPARF